MRGTINLISRTIALIVVFTIGFTTLAGFMIGGGYLAYTKISIDVLQELGVAINTDDHFDADAAEVDITALTIEDWVNEFKSLAQLKDTISIQFLADRYGIKVVSKIPAFVAQKYKEMPLTQLFTAETKQEFLNTTLVGDIYGYEKIDNPEYDAELDEGNPYIWKDGNGQELIGLAALMSSYTLGEILSVSKDPSVLTDDLAIAEVLDLKQITDLPVFIASDNEFIEIDRSLLSKPIDVWVDSDGNASNGMISSIAELKITEVETGIDSLTIGDITSLVSYSDQWYMWSYDTENNRILLEERKDITTELADVTVATISEGNLSDEIMDVELNAVLGYTKDSDGKWYKDGKPVSGLMSSLAEYKVGELDTKVGEVQIGEISEYTYDEENGVWLDENQNPATGILAAISDLTVDQVSDESMLSSKIQSVHVSDIMGYKKNDSGEWCTEDSDGNLTKVTGIMSVIADSSISNASSTVDDADMYKILGYTQKTDENGDLVLDSSGNPIFLDESGEEVHVLMQKIARTKFADIDTLTDDMTIADLIPEDERNEGYMSLLPGTTTLDQLPAAVDKVFRTNSVYTFIEKGVVQFENEEDRQKVIDKFGPGSEYSGVTISQLLLIFANTP